MPPFGGHAVRREIVDLAHYVASLSGKPHDSLRAQLGKPLFAACAACHGADGKGNPALGAPNLTDARLALRRQPRGHRRDHPRTAATA